MELYVVRHGQTIVNVMKRVNAHNNIGINRNGRKQAHKAAEELKNVNIDLVVCSPLKRTRQTCEIVNKAKVSIIFDERLIERDAGFMQFKKDTIIEPNIWYDITKSKVYKNSEGFGSIVKRAQNLIQELNKKYPTSKIMLVTHGDVCKAIYAYLTGTLDSEKISQYKHENCEIKRYRVK